MKTLKTECVSTFDPIHTLVFDWGNTLMKVLPEYDGPMVEWPEIAPVKGIKTALTRLKPHYRLVVATNAADSGAEQVRAALSRAELEGFFSKIYTAQELNNSRKPEIAFFRNLEKALDESPSNLMMIGDDYRSDILGATQAGWRAIWFDPEMEACPGLMPVHTQEVYSMSRLPELIEKRELPGWNLCLTWLLEQNASNNLLLHTQTVAAIAYQLALWLRAARQGVDPMLAHRGGMMHDLAKLLSLRTGASSVDHGRLAAQLLIACEQPELAEIARRHLLFCLTDEDRAPETWEQKVVYFADKLVENTRLVSLEDRLRFLQDRYPRDKDRIEKFLPDLLNLQDELCTAMRMDPEALFSNLKSALYGENTNLRH